MAEAQQLSLEEFLQKKKIDVAALKQHMPELWNEWQALWQEMSPQSFDAQKKFLFNRLRRRFPLVASST
ncbi:MAG: hypothetical protein KatS3mg033_0003 [Thermonema sp.]|uniref:hypothetical protein n=1 Tax=Thermonema sp. TaxID=2231181 RepID=UPI0021DEE0A9|nr:hypothetical protein [Thermonema sp.]GIV38203.1 MAG: hypothetical protein KatS3mg033_0003 [Thermonema sp.]